VAHGRNLFTLAGGTPTLARVRQLGLGWRHGAESSTGSPAMTVGYTTQPMRPA
jgi:catalase (peroxidase I)